MNYVLSLFGLGQFKTYAYVVIVLLVLGLLGWTHWQAFSGGKKYVLNKMAEERIEMFKDGKRIDETVFNADDVGLCTLLGGC